MHSCTTSLVLVDGECGVQFDHGKALKQQGFNLGCGSQGTRFAGLAGVQRCSVNAIYTSLSQPEVFQALPISCSIRGHPPYSRAPIVIGADDRVAAVTAECGFSLWLPGCIANCLSFTIESVDGRIRTEWIGQPRFPLQEHETAADMDTSTLNIVYQGRLKAVRIPPGLTLAGFGGRSTAVCWEQIVLHVSPFLPGGGAWNSRLHRHYCQPFKQQVQTLLLCLNRCSKQLNDPGHHTGSNQPTFLPHLPPEVMEHLVAALFQATFLSSDSTATATNVASSEADVSIAGTAVEEQECTPDCYMAGDSVRQEVLAEGAIGGQSPPRLPGDYIASWVQQQMQQPQRGAT